MSAAAGSVGQGRHNVGQGQVNASSCVDEDESTRVGGRKDVGTGSGTPTDARSVKDGLSNRICGTSGEGSLVDGVAVEGVGNALKNFILGGEDEPTGICFRTHLPSAMFSKQGVSAWNILKQCIGKDLSKITMPVIFSEPLTFLQRMAEYMEYSELLVRAAHSQDPVHRMELITAFAISALAANCERTGKPFNPLLGETFELDCEKELGYRLVCEQVSHHPPISAFHVESRDFILHTSIQPKLKFWGKSLEVTPKGTVTLHLIPHNEVYTWQNVSCYVNNIIVGKMWIEHVGTLEIVNQKTKHKAVLTFKQNDVLGKDLYKVDGYIYDSSDRKVRALYGKWIEALYSYEVEVWETFIKNTRRSLSPSILAFAKSKQSDEPPSRGSTCNLNLEGQKLLWEALPRPDHSEQYYNFTKFAIGLNELHPEICVNLPPTDSRLRPDLRLFEQGDLDGSQIEKNRVEEKQRQLKKDRKRKKEEWEPRWFKPVINPHSSKEDWEFTGQYWHRNWSSCLDIF